MSQKPRLIRLNSRWVVAEHFYRRPSSGALIFYPAGEGDTPKQAWTAAYPPSWFAELIHKLRGTA